MIERVSSTEQTPGVTDERETILDDRLLHMTREEAKAYLDEYIQRRGLADGQDTARDGEK